MSLNAPILFGMEFSAKEGWLRVRFDLALEDGRVMRVSYKASRCKTLRSLAERLKEALLGVEEEEIAERVREVLSGVNLPPDRENRRELLLRAFGLK